MALFYPRPLLPSMPRKIFSFWKFFCITDACKFVDLQTDAECDTLILLKNGVFFGKDR